MFIKRWENIVKDSSVGVDMKSINPRLTLRHESGEVSTQVWRRKKGAKRKDRDESCSCRGQGIFCVGYAMTKYVAMSWHISRSTKRET